MERIARVTASETGRQGWSSDVNSSSTVIRLNEQEECQHLTKVEAQAATCTETGNLEYYKCTYSCESERLNRTSLGCGKVYADAEGMVELSLQSIVVPKLGHQYENGECITCHTTDPVVTP